MLRFHPIGVLSNELAPVGLAVSFGLLGGMFGVVHVLALADGVAHGGGHGIGGIEKLRVLVGLEDEMHHLGHLFLRGVAIARDVLLDGLG